MLVSLHSSDLKVTGATTEWITLFNIPLELNGSRIRCLFTPGYTAASDYAKLHVTDKATEPPTEPTTEPTTELPTDASTQPTKTTEPASEKNTAKKNNTNESDKTDKTDPERNDNQKDTNGNTALLITTIISSAVVAVAGIAAFVILKLKGTDRK